jgi:uncharacterized protein YbjQ (UPF0145 family)
MSSSAEAYSLAYKTHYNRKEYTEALKLYLMVIRDYPDSNEARYANQQIQNLKKQIDFNSIMFDDPSVNQIFEALNIRDAEKEKAIREESERRAAEKAAYNDKIEAVEQLRNNMILSTCSSLEGFHVIEQKGLVFGECLFKTGLLKQIDASFADFSSIISSGDQELSGTTEMLENARKYAINKMIAKAAKLGANAIIGIDSESSMGASIIHITIYGTAVNVEPIGQTESAVVCSATKC